MPNIMVACKILDRFFSETLLPRFAASGTNSAWVEELFEETVLCAVLVCGSMMITSDVFGGATA